MSKESLEVEFKTNDLGTPRSFLGIQFDHHDDSSISLYQQQYILKILSDFYMEDRQPKSMPMNHKAALGRKVNKNDRDENDAGPPHWFADWRPDVSDDRNPTRHRLCADHLESFLGVSPIVPPGGPAPSSPVPESNSDAPNHLLARLLDRIHRYRLQWIHRH